MKRRFWTNVCAAFTFLVAVSACGDDPLNPLFSVQDEINANAPYTRVEVRIGDLRRTFTLGAGGGATEFENAYAENGLLILTMHDGEKIVFNLSTLSSIDIQNTSLYLHY